MPRVRVLAGAVAMATSIVMFLLDGLHITDGLETPAKLFLLLTGYALFGISLPDLLKALAVLTGGISAAAMKAAERTEEEEARGDDA